jgi:hypothetical protein
MSAEDDKAAELRLLPWFSGRSKDAASRGSSPIGARPPSPGWRWNGKEWMYSARYLNDPPVRRVQ